MRDEALSVRRRRSRVEASRLVLEFERSGLARREFCALHGLSMVTLDAWRRRQRQSRSPAALVPVEIVDSRAEAAEPSRVKSAEPSRLFRILLPHGLRIELESGFDAGELQRLLATLATA